MPCSSSNTQEYQNNRPMDLGGLVAQRLAANAQGSVPSEELMRSYIHRKFRQTHYLEWAMSLVSEDSYYRFPGLAGIFSGQRITPSKISEIETVNTN